MNNLHLLLVDCQNSFCTPPLDLSVFDQAAQDALKANPQFAAIIQGGELLVPGAADDMIRVAAMIDRLRDKWDDIHATMDSHRKFDIAHGDYTKDSAGNHPPPFTEMVAQDVIDGRWNASIPRYNRHLIDYLNALEATDRYKHMVWPDHCLIGSWGHQIVPEVLAALHRWEAGLCMVNYVTKGSNPHTEHFSAVQAEVPDGGDPTTQINSKLCGVLEEADLIAVAGEAKYHCVLNTIRDIANTFGDDNIRKLVLLTDAMSPVPDSEKMGQPILDDLMGRGMQTSTTVEFLA